MNRGTLAGALVAGALVVIPSAAADAATQCTGVVSNRTISDTVEVPSGAGCVLVADHINGSVKIDRGGALSLGTQHGSAADTISGNVTGTGPQSFDSYLPGSTISGGLSLTGVSGVPSGGPLAAFGPSFAGDNYNYLDGLRISGPTSIEQGGVNAKWTDTNPSVFASFTYADNRGTLFLQGSDTFGGTLSLRRNTGDGLLANLRVGGSLICGNTPPFTVLGGIRVSGYNGATNGKC